MSSPPGLVVLVVDDELLIRWSIVETMTANGHTLVEAADAATARRVLEELDDTIDVVLLDFRLPDSHDLTLLADIRRRSPGSAVLMMTAFGTPEVEAAALRLGAHAVLAKPFDLTTLEALARQAHDAAHVAPTPHRHHLPGM
jgi:DNA-binding NtrC family response regulator